MNATNKKAIKILKSKMTQDERMKLFKNIVDQHNKFNFIHNINRLLYGTFEYDITPEGFDYWYEIYSRFTEEELLQKIDIK